MHQPKTAIADLLQQADKDQRQQGIERPFANRLGQASDAKAATVGTAAADSHPAQIDGPVFALLQQPV